MTYEKAVETLAPVTVTFSQKGFNREMYEALCLAKEALEKQIPKKPELKEKDWGCIRYVEVCPTCGKYAITYGVPYCDECGQKIDWSESK